ncbi:MAG: tetratricopeptide repeat protein, partial [Bacteroidota bacterium]
MISCNKEKKNLPSRFYHNTTSYFNGYYNANELLNTTTAQLEDQYKFPYEGFIEVINYGSEQEISAFNGDLDEIIKKNDVVIFKHPNGNYIDDGRLLNGIAWFYKQNYSLAMQNFDEVIEKFPESDRVPETYLWIAKTFYQMENKTMSEDILEDNFVFGNRVITDKALLADLAIFRSRIALEKEEYADAARILVEEVDNISVRRRRARAHYLLGQLYDYLKDYPKSLEHYQKVLKNTDAYEFRFRTQMKIARLYVQFHEQDSDDAVEKYLTRLMKDEKNEENLDKIYYEFALLEHKNDSLQNALEFLRQSLKASTGDPVQKTLSYYKSGQIYFDHLQKYPEAQAYYDSAAQVVTTEMSEYEDIKRLAKTLGEYISYKETIIYQDSMLVLAELPKEELDSIVDLVIAEEKRKEEVLKEKELESQLSNSNLDNLYALNNQNGKSNKSQGGEWYFDKPATISNGKLEFQQLWGNRKNEDNWRRKNKTDCGRRHCNESPGHELVSPAATAVSLRCLQTPERTKSPSAPFLFGRL